MILQEILWFISGFKRAHQKDLHTGRFALQSLHFFCCKTKTIIWQAGKNKRTIIYCLLRKKYIAKNEHTLFYETIDSISFQQLKNVSVISWKCVFMCFLWKVFLCSLWWFNYIRIYDKASWVMNTVNWLSCHTITIFLLPGNVHLQSLFFHYFFSSSPNTSPKL